MATRIRTARSISESARWTPSPRRSWQYWAVIALAVLLVLIAPSQWRWLVSAVLAFAAPWVAERVAPSSPDLDEPV